MFKRRSLAGSLIESDAKYRFVIDMATLRQARTRGRQAASGPGAGDHVGQRWRDFAACSADSNRDSTSPA
jgi:hypothetical protein